MNNNDVVKEVESKLDKWNNKDLDSFNRKEIDQAELVRRLGLSNLIRASIEVYRKSGDIQALMETLRTDGGKYIDASRSKHTDK